MDSKTSGYPRGSRFMLNQAAKDVRDRSSNLNNVRWRAAASSMTMFVGNSLVTALVSTPMPITSTLLRSQRLMDRATSWGILRGPICYYDQHLAFFTSLGELKGGIPNGFRHRGITSRFEPEPTGSILNSFSMFHSTEHRLLLITAEEGNGRIHAGDCIQRHSNGEDASRAMS